jgi:hypothetical protein
MKNLMLVACLFTFFLNDVNSKHIINKSLIEIVEFNNDVWELIKSENGINVYYSTYEEVSGEMGLKIKFENTLNQDIKTYWSLQKDDNYIFEKVVLNIGASSIYQFDHTAIMIPFGQNDLLTDFKITFLQK